jgi:succinate--hydroxymethylglutarate CoA-transferase
VERRTPVDGAQHIVSSSARHIQTPANTVIASIVPYKGFKTADGDILLGGGNDRLFGVICQKLGKPEWAKDERYVTNNVRVKHRAELEEKIEAITKKKTTQQWLDILEGSGMPYAAINDVKATLEHEHCELTSTKASLLLVVS